MREYRHGYFLWMYYRYVEDTGLEPKDWLDLFEVSEYKSLRGEIDGIVRSTLRQSSH